MCGILGFTSYRLTENYDTALYSQHHRGPDYMGTFADKDNHILLAHNRLSIIDLTDHGNQPMSDPTGEFWITYNGELYNFREIRSELIQKGYRFTSGTDTEVVLNAYIEWKEACLSRFQGMFSFTIYDKPGDLLFFARDRLGIKPFYYYHHGGNFAFSSEAKAIIALPFYQKAIHYPALFSFLMYRYIPGNNSIWKDIHRLSPGHYGTYIFSNNQCNIQSYWEIPLQEKKWDEAEALIELDYLLDQAVSSRLMSDVPIGVFLSGGIDSSTITKYASEYIDPVNTFTVGFEGASASELKEASQTAALFNTKHTADTISVYNASQLISELFKYWDEPLGDSSIIPTYLVCQMASKYVKVILAGDGGDELFGGYMWYLKLHKLQLLQHVTRLIRPILGYLPEPYRYLNSIFEQYRILTSPRFTVSELKALFPPETHKHLPLTNTWLYEKYYRPDLSFYKRWQYIDAQTFMVDDILTKVDRSSMAHSLEVRVPFLEHRIVELAFSLPDKFCINKKSSKYLLKKLMAKYLPTDILHRPKQGFSCPVHLYWAADSMVASIDNGYLLKEGLMHKNTWETYKRGQVYQQAAKIWQLAVLEKWSSNWLFSY